MAEETACEMVEEIEYEMVEGRDEQSSRTQGYDDIHDIDVHFCPTLGV